MMARSEDKTREAMDDIKTSVEKSSGELHFIKLDLADMPSIKTSADEFLARESQLHLLFNNAGVGYPDKGATTKQGYELQLGVNCLGPFGLTKLLAPTMAATARASAPNSVRVVWVSSSAAEAIHPEAFLGALPRVEAQGAMDKYSISKLGNYLHAAEFAARHGRHEGVVSVSMNPGALDSDFWRGQGGLTTFVLRRTVLHPPVYGAYTSFFAAFSPDIVAVDGNGSGSPAGPGTHVAPWGQLWRLSREMQDAAKSKSQGGSGVASEFWEWCEEQWEPYW